MEAFSDVVNAFDLFAEEYDRWFDSPDGRILFKAEVEAVRVLMKNLEKPFLEVGVGTGRFAKELGIEFGIDSSHRALEIAERRGIKVKEAKGESLPFKDGSFGAVFLLFTICFVDDPEKIFLEAKRALKNGGGLIVGIINRESLWGELYMKKKSEGHPIYKHARFYSIDEVLKMLGETGMAVEAYSSTLCQSPSEKPYKEAVHKGLAEGAGFVCILARKPLGVR
ncbi:MAG: class I SAM-dependent methyltransferase [Nitrospirae bacterium]|nr:class I SAM-dependent methyltransferase [Nitrospirota bacterium]